MLLQKIEVNKILIMVYLYQQALDLKNNILLLLQYMRVCLNK